MVLLAMGMQDIIHCLRLAIKSFLLLLFCRLLIACRNPANHVRFLSHSHHLQLHDFSKGHPWHVYTVDLGIDGPGQWVSFLYHCIGRQTRWYLRLWFLLVCQEWEETYYCLCLDSQITFRDCLTL